MAIATLGAWAGAGRSRCRLLSAIVDAPYIRPGSSWTYKVEELGLGAPRWSTLTSNEARPRVQDAGVLAFAAGNETILNNRDPNFRGGRLPTAHLREASPLLRSVPLPFHVRQGVALGVHFQDNQKGLS